MNLSDRVAVQTAEQFGKVLLSDPDPVSINQLPKKPVFDRFISLPSEAAAKIQPLSVPAKFLSRFLRKIFSPAWLATSFPKRLQRYDDLRYYPNQKSKIFLKISCFSKRFVKFAPLPS
jgi:hypothetical protein